MKIRTLKELREGKKKTQEDIAKEFNVSKEYISMLERGIKNPSDKLKTKMSKFYGVSVSYIFLSVNQTKCFNKTNK